MGKSLNAILMKTFKDKIIQAQLIYKSQSTDSALRAWPLKKTKCEVFCYEDVSCSDIETVICSTLHYNDHALSAEDLATILGFNVKDDIESNPKRYKDDAELCIFKRLLSSLKKDELIEDVEDEIRLTSLGLFSVINSKKRLFYKAECRFFENFSLNSSDGRIFPFRKELSISTTIQNKKRVSFYKTLSQYDIEPQIKEEEKILVEALREQTQEGTNIFSASLLKNDFLIESERLDIAIYNDGDDFVVVSSKGESVSEHTSQLLNSDENAKTKAIKVEWGYYLRLLNDSNALLSSESLAPFEDIIEWGKVVKDSRFCWNDAVLFNMLSRNIDANIWHEVSTICPIDDIKTYLRDSSDNWDWSVLSARIDGKFITENASNYPWDFDVVIHNAQVSIEDVERLLVNPNLTSVSWIWTDIMPSLSNEFIIEHIDDVSFDLSLITENNPELVKSMILDYPDKAWNWAYISKSYGLDYILDNIELLLKRLNLQSIIIRVFSSDEYAQLFCKSKEFKKELYSIHNSSISTFNVNTLELVWNKENIDFLEEVGLLSWCVPVIGGFESNSYINWDKEFFSNYANRINNNAGYTCVTSRIDDFTIVDDNPDFMWDWEIISSKNNWINEVDFVRRHISKLNLGKAFWLFSSETFCVLFECSEVKDFILSHPELQTKATELATIQLVKTNINFSWDWYILTIKTVETLKVDKLGNERWVDKWDWDYLSENLKVEDISNYLYDYQEYWNWTVLTRRLTNSTILGNLVDFADKWDWITLIDTILTKNDLSIDGYLSTIAAIISLKEENIQNILWTKITQRFTLEELYNLVHRTVTITDYSLLFKWDLSYIYDHKEFNLNEYIELYPDDVDWELLSKSKSAERLFYYDRSILSFEMWLKMVKSLLYNDLYYWDFYALSQNEAINWYPSLLKIKKKQWDWKYLSEHSKCFSDYSGAKNQSNLSKNIKQFKDVLDFGKLSNRNDITFDDSLLKEFNSEAWDWKSISSSEKLSVSNEFLIKNQDKDWDWCQLSQSHKLIIDKELLGKTKQRNWDWGCLSSNPALKISLSDLLSLEIPNWDWVALSGRNDIEFDNESVISTIDKPQITWDWTLLSSRRDLTYDENLILKIIHKPIDWKYVSSVDTFVPSVTVLSKLSSYDLDWDAISQNNSLTKDVLWPYREKLNWHFVSQSETFQRLGRDFFLKYRDYLDWAIISKSTNFSLSIENLREFKDDVYWRIIDQRDDFLYTNELIESFPDYINWSEASRANTINFTIDFVKKYSNRWDWKALLNNPLIVQKEDMYYSAFKEKINGVKFIERFSDSNPKVYHFAHLFNAVSIIRSRKILSRIGGKGLFENSAGSNVHRRDTAHHYARFYYRPQTPTQYYNEALGEDSHSSGERYVFRGYDYRGKKIWDSILECPTAKYWGAQNLGSPKCPMPVFFEFDLHEILNYYLERCYYSTGNMQKDVSQVIPIIKDPYRLNTSFLYSTIKDGIDTYKAYSQQEFLVLNELDFSSLEKYRIICYDEEQANLLKQQLEGDPICEHITTDDYTSSGISIFHRTNRTISVDETEDTISIETNYRDSSSIVIECDDVNGIDIIDKRNITSITKDKIQAYPSISFKKQALPITVRFMDEKNSWIIYSNIKGMAGSTMSYPKIPKHIIDQFVKEVSGLQIKISKSLFKEHMLYSYHGIAHTVRVMWNGFAIASLDNTIDETMLAPILYASLIHDLGKRSDTEGEKHGEQSAILYREAIHNLFGDNEAEAILEAIKYHSIDDSKCPAKVKSNVIWQILKDADALDRSRLPGKGCNPSFLRNTIFTNETGKDLLSLSRMLPSLTNGMVWDSPIEELSNVLRTLIVDNGEDDIDKLSCIEFINDKKNIDWKIILAENIMLFSDMSKNEKCEMLFGYAESLSDSLTAKLGFDKSEESFYKYVETSENGIVDKRLDKYVAQKYQILDEKFYNELQKLDILYIEKNVENLEPLRYCKNLKFLVFDSYWIAKYKFKDFTPLKHLQNVYIWHNSGDTRIDNSFSEYTNIDSFNNIRYSESADDPWSDFCDEVTKFKIK